MNYERLLKAFLLAVSLIIAGVTLVALLVAYPEIACVLILIGLAIWFTFVFYKWFEFKGE